MSSQVGFTERFWRHVNKTGAGGCWHWTGVMNGKGYGAYSSGIRYVNETAAHRISWSLTNGAVPDGLFVLHRCDKPYCVNPEHLFLGTLQDNSDDCVAKGRQAKGVGHGRAKLTIDQVRNVRRMIKDGVRQRTIARLFGIDQSAVCLINRGKNWGHLP